MKKILFLAVTLFALAGCTAHRTSNAEKLQQARVSKSSAVASSREKKKETVKITSQTVYYHQLTKADRDKVTFAFQATSDTTKAESGQVYNAPSPYTVDMQVTNKSNKTVKLDESKVVWLAITQKVDPTTSDKEKTITIKPNKTQNVVGLFSDFNSQNFVDAGAFCYLNADYKLAYSYLAYKDGGVTSKNLMDKKLIAMNTTSATNVETSQASSSTESVNQDDSSTSQKYTGQQLALLAQVFGQKDTGSIDVADTLSGLQGSTISYSADTDTTGHSSMGTALSYEQYTISGATLMIMHPAGQGSDAWSGSVELNEALNKVFVQNAAQAQAVLRNMQPE